MHDPSAKGELTDLPPLTKARRSYTISITNLWQFCLGRTLECRQYFNTDEFHYTDVLCALYVTSYYWCDETGSSSADIIKWMGLPRTTVRHSIRRTTSAGAILFDKDEQMYYPTKSMCSYFTATSRQASPYLNAMAVNAMRAAVEHQGQCPWCPHVPTCQRRTRPTEGDCTLFG